MEKVDYDSLKRFLNKQFTGRELLNYYLKEFDYLIGKINWDNLKELIASPLGGAINSLLFRAEINTSKTTFNFLLIFLNICFSIALIIFSFSGPILIIGLVIIIVKTFESGVIFLLIFLYIYLQWRLKEILINRLGRKYLSGKIVSERFKPLLTEFEYRSRRHLITEKE